MYTLIRLMPLFWEQLPPTISDRVKQQKKRSGKCFLVFWAGFVCDLGYLITIKSYRGHTIFHMVPGRECASGPLPKSGELTLKYVFSGCTRASNDQLR